VNENAEKLVLYGRDIMGDSIVSASEALDENELVIITNEKREAIGVGRTRFAGKSILAKGRITITTLADAGQYLRDEG
jgi:predicted RNA-binding protein (TIGR00451 family)